MAIRARENNIGAWAFLIGVILAIIIGILTSFVATPNLTAYNKIFYSTLVVLGLIVGFLNVSVTNRDAQTFLLASAVLVIVSKFGMDAVNSTLISIGIGNFVSSVFGALLVLFVPATIIVALKTVFSIAKV